MNKINNIDYFVKRVIYLCCNNILLLCQSQVIRGAYE